MDKTAIRVYKQGLGLYIVSDTGNGNMREFGKQTDAVKYAKELAKEKDVALENSIWRLKSPY